MEYPITYQNKGVGHALLTQKGLYIQISCRCILPQEDIYKIRCISSLGEINVGVCIPHAGYLVAQKTVSGKSIDITTVSFIAYSKTKEDAVSAAEDTAEKGTDAEKTAYDIEKLPTSRYDPQRGIIIYG